MQMPLIQDDRVDEALSTDSPDQSLDEWILPGTSWCGDHLLDAHVFDPALEECSVDRVPITQEVARRAVPRECLHDLLSSPLSCRALVMLKWKTRRRSWAKIRRTKRICFFTVGTMKKSTAAMSAI